MPRRGWARARPLSWRPALAWIAKHRQTIHLLNRAWRMRSRATPRLWRSSGRGRRLPRRASRSVRSRRERAGSTGIRPAGTSRRLQCWKVIGKPLQQEPAWSRVPSQQRRQSRPEPRTVVELAIVGIGPDVRAVGGRDELRGDAGSLTGFSDTALEHVTHFEPVGDLRHVERLVCDRQTTKCGRSLATCRHVQAD